MAGEEVVNDADHFFVEAKHPTVTETKPHSISVGALEEQRAKKQNRRAHNEMKPHGRNSQPRPAYLAAAEVLT